jgi:hypothetical protein
MRIGVLFLSDRKGLLAEEKLVYLSCGKKIEEDHAYCPKWQKTQVEWRDKLG